MSSSDIEPCPFCGRECRVSHGDSTVSCYTLKGCGYRSGKLRIDASEARRIADHLRGDEALHALHRAAIDRAVAEHNAVARRARAMDELVSEVAR